jgi:4-hydroxybenzoate polyprenyltransferase
LVTIIVGACCAGLLNAASNVINQVYDLDNDRINKPLRPLVSGEIAVHRGWRYAVVLYALAIPPTWLIVIEPVQGLTGRILAPLSRHECFLLFSAGLLFTLIYSAPAFGRTKAHPFLANLTIAIPRGCLLKVAGWSLVASVFHVEPWFIGLIFFLFLLGASSTKDFSDMKGDEAAGCQTLPVRYGVERAAHWIAPFFVVPWLLLPLGAWLPAPSGLGGAWLSGHPWILTGLGTGLALWGLYTVRLILRDPRSLAERENHPSWTHMYLMLMVAQVGFALAYLTPF